MSKLKYSKMPLMILIVNMFIAQVGVGLIIPILPKFVQDFGVNNATLGYLVSAMGFTQFLFSPLAGKWADQYGRKIIIVSGIGLFSVSQYLFGVANELWMLYVSRLIGGIGIAFTTPAITAYVADITTEENRGKSLGWIGAAMSFGVVIGPGIGGFLAEYGLRLPFYVASAASAFSMVAAFLLLPETLSQEKQLLARNSLRKSENIFSQVALSFKAPYLFLLVLIFILTFGLVSVEVVFGLYVDVKYGYTPKDIAILLMVGVLMGVLVQALLIDWLLRCFGEKRVINMSLVLSAASLALMLLPGSFWYILLVTTLHIAFTSILRPAINTLLSKMAGEEQGFVAGMNNAYTSLGIIIGPSIAGILFDIHINLPYLFGVTLILVSLAIPALTLKKERAQSVCCPKNNWF
ncbi:MFS transporter [Pelosinus fermentans]|uniref:Major facilitator superfamily MFS_1 n=1 Tax=Pelosinus fermentans JBW45 TaxID=1192197 RepID=I8TTF9_9FIRM|nr:tetracycline resistance MFS efflux pump [Pelosinus fermentans]AJQ29606.1 major facilitator superfamily MFS_1 [Pelosinus fermentans JBW45]